MQTGPAPVFDLLEGFLRSSGSGGTPVQSLGACHLGTARSGRDLALGRAMDAGVGPAGVPAIEVGLGRVEILEAQPFEGGLRVPDGRLHLALAIGIADTTGQCDDAVVRQYVAVERIEGGVVDVRCEHALAEIVEDGDLHGAAEAAKRLLMQLAPAARARRDGQQADALAAVAEREKEEPRAAVLPRYPVADHRAVAVV